jgi:hypothetical protein
MFLRKVALYSLGKVRSGERTTACGVATAG